MTRKLWRRHYKQRWHHYLSLARSAVCACLNILLDNLGHISLACMAWYGAIWCTMNVLIWLFKHAHYDISFVTSRREKLYNAHRNKVANFDSALKRDENLLPLWLPRTSYITRTFISFVYHLFEIVWNWSLVVVDGLHEYIRLSRK